MMVNVFNICTDLSDEQSAFDGIQKTITFSFISFLRLQLNEFLQLKIKQKLSSVQKFTCIIAIIDKICSPPQSVVQIKQFPEEDLEAAATSKMERFVKAQSIKPF